MKSWKKTRGSHHRTLALVSQSGAYMITRMNKLNFLDPAYAISIGNQIDLTAADFLHFLNTVDELQTLAFFMEGFADLDGLGFDSAVRKAIPLGKEVIFYKAGRTPEGKNALSGHTASIAGDKQFRSADIAVGVLGKYIHNRLQYRPLPILHLLKEP